MRAESVDELAVRFGRGDDHAIIGVHGICAQHRNRGRLCMLISPTKVRLLMAGSSLCGSSADLLSDQSTRYWDGAGPSILLRPKMASDVLRRRRQDT